MNLFRKNNLQTNITTVTPCSVCGTTSGENDLKNSIRWIGFPTMTTHLLTLLCQYVNFWIRTHTPYSPDVAPCDLFLFPKLNTALKGIRFNDITMTQEKSRDAPAKIREML
jgi:hypothetical protein